MTTTSSIDWKALVRKIDKDFDKESISPVVYKFSGSREFKDRNPPSPGAGLTWDQLDNIRWTGMIADWDSA
jgi:hypothetical protein